MNFLTNLRWSKLTSQSIWSQIFGQHSTKHYPTSEGFDRSGSHSDQRMIGPYCSKKQLGSFFWYDSLFFILSFPDGMSFFNELSFLTWCRFLYYDFFVMKCRIQMQCNFSYRILVFYIMLFSHFVDVLFFNIWCRFLRQHSFPISDIVTIWCSLRYYVFMIDAVSSTI